MFIIGNFIRWGCRQWIGVGLLSTVIFIWFFCSIPEDLSQEAWQVAAIAIIMAVLWTTEVFPVHITALLPLIAFPALQILDLQEAAVHYVNPIIFLFMGGFLIALAMQRWGLHKRIALGILGAVSTRMHHIIGGFMLATALLSMWVSNTATVIMMYSIGLSVVHLVNNHPGDISKKERQDFSVALMLGIAYAGSIGGTGTLIGTPPNALMAGFLLENYNIRIGFGQWMLLGVPLVLISLPLVWFILTRLVFKVNKQELHEIKGILNEERQKLGKYTSGECIVMVVALITAVLWVTRPLLSHYMPFLTDTKIAMFGGLVLFLIPVSSVHDSIGM